MSILEELANEVKNQRDILANNLSSLGVEASTSETLNSLVAKVSLIRNGIVPLIVVTVADGATVTATCEGTKVTKVSENGTAQIEVNKFGTWTIYAEKDAQKSNTVTLIINRDIKEETLSFFAATITVTVEAGSQVTVSKDGFNKTVEATDGTASIVVPSAGSYSVKATLNGITSNTETVVISSNGESKSVQLKYITLTVTCPAGSSVSVVKGDFTYTAIATSGTANFYLPEIGEWSVTIGLNGQSSSGTVNVTEYKNYTIELAYYVTYGVRIALNNSNPETSVEYTDDAVGVGSGWNNWKDKQIFKDIKPCLLKGGVVQYYLQRDNYTKKENGENSTLTGNDGDVMVEFPKIGYKMSNDSNYQYIQITDNPNAEGYCYLAHSLDAENDCDKIYIGAYLANAPEWLQSISSATPETSISLTAARGLAQAKGVSYQLLSFYPLTLLQCLYVIIYKNLNSQAALGRGYTGGSSKVSTGSTNTEPFCFGNPQSAATQVKFLGIEDFYGNLFQWIDGLYCDSLYHIKTDYNNFTGSDGNHFRYSQPSGISSNAYGWLKKIQGTNNTGFVIKSTGSSETTYYADYAYLGSGFFGYFGGDWSNGADAGAFLLYVNFAASLSRSSLGCRVVYKHKA